MSQIRTELDALARTLKNIADTGLSHARRQGADEAKVAMNASFSKRLVVEAGEFSLANSLESRSLGILVHKDKKKGSATINTVSEGSMRSAVEDALALAKYSVPDQALKLAGRDIAPPAARLGFLFDEALAEMSLETLQGMMQEILGRLTRDKRIALDRFEMSIDTSWHGMANSHGVTQEESQTMCTWSFFGMARDGEQVTGFDYDGSFALNQDAILAKAMGDADRFTAKLISFLNPGKCPSYNGAVLLTPRAVQELLTGMILYHAGGRQVMDGKSRWEKDVGNQVVSNLLSLNDQPHDQRFAGATSYDSDGVPTRSQSIIENGVLKLHLHDVYSANRLNAKSTATAGGPFAMAFGAGKSSLADLRRQPGSLLLVDRFSGNDDPIKGAFSGVAKSSRLFVDGADRGAVTETMIAGNFFDVASKVLGVSAEQEMVSGSFLSPYILVDGVSVTGQA